MNHFDWKIFWIKPYKKKKEKVSTFFWIKPYKNKKKGLDFFFEEMFWAIPKKVSNFHKNSPKMTVLFSRQKIPQNDYFVLTRQKITPKPFFDRTTGAIKMNILGK
jgi:hypothetical protein